MGIKSISDWEEVFEVNLFHGQSCGSIYYLFDVSVLATSGQTTSRFDDTSGQTTLRFDDTSGQTTLRFDDTSGQRTSRFDDTSGQRTSHFDDTSGETTSRFDVTSYLIRQFSMDN